MEELKRPLFATDEALNYLDDLRESGVTNMFGAGPYLAREFGIDNRDARQVVVYWMETFPRKPIPGTPDGTSNG